MDPLIAFKNEALSMWEELGINIRSTILRTIVHQVGTDHSHDIISNQTLIPENKPLVNDLPLINKAPEIHIDGKVGRNDQCPCGSGLKYKKCHGLN
jgi:preprotein translocase subunit SecA